MMIWVLATGSVVVFTLLWWNTASRPSFLSYVFFVFGLWCTMVMAAIMADAMFGQELVEAFTSTDYRSIIVLTLAIGTTAITLIHFAALLFANDLSNWAKVKFFYNI